MKKGINKSAAIRELHTKNPELSAPEIVAQLEKNGIAVSAPLVYQIFRKSPKGTGKKRGPKPGATKVKTAAASPLATTDLFASMKNFVEAAGGLDKAIEILSVFKN
ncbi:MAG: hypothetical protein WCK15_13695 [Pirellula sp.]